MEPTTKQDVGKRVEELCECIWNRPTTQEVANSMVSAVGNIGLKCAGIEIEDAMPHIIDEATRLTKQYLLDLRNMGEQGRSHRYQS
jgi:hypothetical protein